MIPDNILKRMAPADRKSLGKAGMTSDEAAAKCEAKREKQLHEQILAGLRRRDIFVIRSRMDKRTTTQRGIPDLIFAIRGKAVGMEIKLPSGVLSEEQGKVMRLMEKHPNLWKVCVVRSYDDAMRVVDDLLRNY